VEALTQVMSDLPPSLGAAVLVVLHIPAHSRSHLPEVLQKRTHLNVQSAGEGQPLEPGNVYIAPPDHHLMLEHGQVRLTRGPRECRVRPAIDVLFRSAAATYGRRVVGVILSGTLDDGTAGLWAVKDRGGVALVQDPKSAAHTSMPESACRFVEVDAVLPPKEIGAEIARRVAVLADLTPIHSVYNERIEIETAIARDGNGIGNGVMKLGHSSAYTCPECHRVLSGLQKGASSAIAVTAVMPIP
jgi:two-component system chemotaxis response regulator CheB